MKHILIAGSTGLIGSAAVHLALADARFARVISLSRKPLDLDHPKLEQWCAPDLLNALQPQKVDAVVCCLGTTMRNVGGDRSKFIHVDKDLVLGLARWAKSQGVPVFAVVSAIGADPASRVFYNRVKGEMEEGLKSIGLPTLHILHPSILTGPRAELRTGERIGIAAMRLIAPLLPSRYKPMPHDVLAKALLNSAFEREGGTYPFAEINALAARN